VNEIVKKKPMSIELKILMATILIPLLLVMLNFVNYLFTNDMNEFKGILGMIIIFSTFVIVTPQFMLRYVKYRTIKEYEEKFPIFLRDLIESLRSGMPFHKSLMMTSKLDYGKLSDEIKKMSNQLSWGIPFDKVISQFRERVRHSKRLEMAMNIIRETNMYGGDVVSTLESLAENSIILEDAEKEKKSLLNQYVVLMYAISFLFVGIVAAINRLMVPIFQTSTMGTAGEIIGLTNPCESRYGLGTFVCGVFDFISEFIFNIDKYSIGAYYTSLFFCMSIVVAMCCGLIAGQISENSVLAGVKHSLIMTIVVIGAFYLLISLKILGV